MSHAKDYFLGRLPPLIYAYTHVILPCMLSLFVLSKSYTIYTIIVYTFFTIAVCAILFLSWLVYVFATLIRSNPTGHSCKEFEQENEGNDVFG